MFQPPVPKRLRLKPSKLKLVSNVFHTFTPSYYPIRNQIVLPRHTTNSTTLATSSTQASFYISPTVFPTNVSYLLFIGTCSRDRICSKLIAPITLKNPNSPHISSIKLYVSLTMSYRKVARMIGGRITTKRYTRNSE